MFRPLLDRRGRPWYVGHRHVHRRCRLGVPCTQSRTTKGLVISFGLRIDIRVSGPLSPTLHIGISIKVPPPRLGPSRARLSERWCPIHGGRYARDTRGYISVTRGGWNTQGARILTPHPLTYPKTISEVQSSTYRTVSTARRPCRILAQSPCTSPDVPHVTICESSEHVSTNMKMKCVCVLQ